jgi:hypothetical protein
MAIRIKQESAHSSTGWWNWSVWLNGNKDELDRVKHVVYTLHPTFIDPVQTVKSRRTNFKLSASGWGEFQIHIEIVGRDGKVSKRQHWLRLEDKPKPGGRAAPREEPAAPAPKPTAFLSFGVADAPIADAVRAGLTAGGFEVSSPSDVARSIPVERAVDDMLQRANVSVFVVSGRPSLWQSQEMAKAVSAKRGTIVPVLVGTDTPVPPQLEPFKPIYVTDASTAKQVATVLAQKALGSDLA